MLGRKLASHGGTRTMLRRELASHGGEDHAEKRASLPWWERHVGRELASHGVRGEEGRVPCIPLGWVRCTNSGS